MPGSRAGSVKIKFKIPTRANAEPAQAPVAATPVVAAAPPPPPPRARTPPRPLPRPMVEANEADFMLEDLEVSLPSNLDTGLSIQTSGMGSGGEGGSRELQLEHVLNLSPTERYDLSMDGQSNSLLLDDSWLQNT